MSNSLFDLNTWYAINFASGNSMFSSGVLYANYQGMNYGSAFLSPFNKSDSTHPQYWQFFPSPTNSSQYVIRPGNAHPPVWLTAPQELVYGTNHCKDDCSSTTVGITNETNPASYWTVSPSGDGHTSFLSNSANGSAWYISVDTQGPTAGSWLHMGNSGGNATQMKFEFSSIDKINDKAFSTLAPTFTSSSPSSNPATGTPGVSTPPPESTSHSVNIGAAVGGAVGGTVVLVIAVVAGLWAWRRRRKSTHEAIPSYEAVMNEKGDMKLAEPQPTENPSEAPGESQILEAPTSKDTGLAGGATDPLNSSHVFEMEGEGSRSGSIQGRFMR